MQRAASATDTQGIGGALNPARPIGSSDMVGLMRVLDERTQASVLQRSVDPLMEFVYARMTDGARFIAHIPVACGKGCSYCCRVWVDTTPPEVLFAVKHMPPMQRSSAAQAVENACRQTTGASFEERCGKVNPPCPLLGPEGACTIYETRPVACRTLVSTDAEQCRQTFMEGSELGFPGLKVWMTLRDSYATALEGALLHNRLAHQGREWNESLRIAMTTPDAEERWLSGADDFAAAPVAPAPAIFDSPVWRAIYQQAFGSAPF